METRLSFGSKVKSKAYPKQDIVDLIMHVENKKHQAYLALSYCLACRSGELLPYQHFKKTYKKDENGKLMLARGKRGPYAKLESIVPSWSSEGVLVEDIMNEYDSEGNVHALKFSKIPVFKTKQVSFDVGYIIKENNPFWDIVISYVNDMRVANNRNRLAFGKPLHLFEMDKVNDTPYRFFYRFRNNVMRSVKKIRAEFKLHSLRVSRATDVAELSGGDIFYTQSITRHRDIRNLEQYVKPVQLKNAMFKYEGKKKEGVV